MYVHVIAMFSLSPLQESKSCKIWGSFASFSVSLTHRVFAEKFEISFVILLDWLLSPD